MKFKSLYSYLASNAEVQVYQTAKTIDSIDTMDIRYDYVASDRLGRDYWRVVNTFRFYSLFEGERYYALVPSGFLTDGATIPRFLWWLFPPWGRYGQAAALHDCLCEHPQLYNDAVIHTVSRKYVDRVFYDVMLFVGVPKWKAKLMYLGVRCYAKWPFKKSNALLRSQKQALEKAWIISK